MVPQQITAVTSYELPCAMCWTVTPAECGKGSHVTPAECGKGSWPLLLFYDSLEVGGTLQQIHKMTYALRESKHFSIYNSLNIYSTATHNGTLYML